MDNLNSKENFEPMSGNDFIPNMPKHDNYDGNEDDLIPNEKTQNNTNDRLRWLNKPVLYSASTYDFQRQSTSSSSVCSKTVNKIKTDLFNSSYILDLNTANEKDEKVKTDLSSERQIKQDCSSNGGNCFLSKKSPYELVGISITERMCLTTPPIIAHIVNVDIPCFEGAYREFCREIYDALSRVVNEALLAKPSESFEIRSNNHQRIGQHINPNSQSKIDHSPKKKTEQDSEQIKLFEHGHQHQQGIGQQNIREMCNNPNENSGLGYEIMTLHELKKRKRGLISKLKPLKEIHYETLEEPCQLPEAVFKEININENSPNDFDLNGMKTFWKNFQKSAEKNFGEDSPPLSEAECPNLKLNLMVRAQLSKFDSSDKSDPTYMLMNRLGSTFKDQYRTSETYSINICKDETNLIDRMLGYNRYGELEIFRYGQTYLNLREPLQKWLMSIKVNTLIEQIDLELKMIDPDQRRPLREPVIEGVDFDEELLKGRVIYEDCLTLLLYVDENGREHRCDPSQLGINIHEFDYVVEKNSEDECGDVIVLRDYEDWGMDETEE